VFPSWYVRISSQKQHVLVSIPQETCKETKTTVMSETGCRTVPCEGLFRCCNVQPRRSRWLARRKHKSHPSQLEDECQRTSEARCLFQKRTVSSEPPELSLPVRNGVIIQIFGQHIVVYSSQTLVPLQNTKTETPS
jgi:hypothetical protein